MRAALRAVVLVVMLGASGVASLAVAAPGPHQDAKADAMLDDAMDKLRTKRVREAISAAEAALARARAARSIESELDALQVLALAHRDVPDLRKVLDLRQQALAFVRAHPEVFAADGRREESWEVHALSGAYFLLGDMPNAVRTARAAVDMEAPHVTKFDTVGLGRFRQRLGQLLFLSGQFAESEKVLRQSYEDFETRLKLTSSVDNNGPNSLAEYGFEVDVLRWLQRALVAQGRSDEALEIAERGRTRTLAASMGQKAASAVAGKAMSIADIKALARSRQSTLVAYTVLYELDPDLLLEFSDFDQIPATGLLVWVVRPDGSVGFRQVDLAKFDTPLAPLITQTRRGLGVTGRGGAKGAAQQAAIAPPKFAGLQQLHRILIEPIDDLLPKEADSRVVLLPQDLLYNVPFAALQDRSGRFLASRFAVAFNPAFSAFAYESQLLNRSVRDAKGVVAMGNPAMPTLPAARGQPAERLAELPQAEAEARDVASLFGARAVVGAGATKRAVVDAMSGARVVHLATHGLMDDDPERAPYFNSLAMAPGAGDSGFLAAREIGRLPLNAELVVLSACDTADGKPTGDGVLGFSNAFLAAGAASVVVAQWSIPDAPTASLMRTFYANLLRGRDKASALQQAMLATMKEHPHPANWAAFVLFGETNAGEGFASIKGNSVRRDRDGAALDSSIAVPADLKGYMEIDGSGPVPSIMYQTPMTTAQIFAFYRSTYAKRGYKEDAALTIIEAKTGSMVLLSPAGKRLVVQVTQFDDPPGAASRHVSARFE